MFNAYYHETYYPSDYNGYVIFEHQDYFIARPDICNIILYELLKDGVKYNTSDCVNLDSTNGKFTFKGVNCRDENLQIRIHAKGGVSKTSIAFRAEIKLLCLKFIRSPPMKDFYEEFVTKSAIMNQMFFDGS